MRKQDEEKIGRVEDYYMKQQTEEKLKKN